MSSKRRKKEKQQQQVSVDDVESEIARLNSKIEQLQKEIRGLKQTELQPTGSPRHYGAEVPARSLQGKATLHCKVLRKRISRGVQYDTGVCAKKYQVVLNCLQAQSSAIKDPPKKAAPKDETNRPSVKRQREPRRGDGEKAGGYLDGRNMDERLPIGAGDNERDACRYKSDAGGDRPGVVGPYHRAKDIKEAKKTDKKIGDSESAGGSRGSPEKLGKGDGERKSAIKEKKGCKKKSSLEEKDKNEKATKDKKKTNSPKEKENNVTKKTVVYDVKEKSEKVKSDTKKKNSLKEKDKSEKVNNRALKKNLFVAKVKNDTKTKNASDEKEKSEKTENDAKTKSLAREKEKSEKTENDAKTKSSPKEKEKTLMQKNPFKAKRRSEKVIGANKEEEKNDGPSQTSSAPAKRKIPSVIERDKETEAKSQPQAKKYAESSKNDEFETEKNETNMSDGLRKIGETSTVAFAAVRSKMKKVMRVGRAPAKAKNFNESELISIKKQMNKCACELGQLVRRVSDLFRRCENSRAQ